MTKILKLVVFKKHSIIILTKKIDGLKFRSEPMRYLDSEMTKLDLSDFLEIQSHFTYLAPTSNMVYGPYEYQIRQLQIFENRSIRAVFFNDYHSLALSIDEIFSKYKLSK